MKLDEELNYMETVNDRHKQNQSYMLERSQKETTFVQEQTIKLHEAEMHIASMEKEYPR